MKNLINFRTAFVPYNFTAPVTGAHSYSKDTRVQEMKYTEPSLSEFQTSLSSRLAEWRKNIPVKFEKPLGFMFEENFKSWANETHVDFHKDLDYATLYPENSYEEVPQNN